MERNELPPVEQLENSARSMGKAAAAFYKALVDGGVPEGDAGRAMHMWVEGMFQVQRGK